MVACLGRGADLHMAKLMPLPLTLLLQEIQIGFGFAFLVPAHPGSPGQNPESHKTVVVVSWMICLHVMGRHEQFKIASKLLTRGQHLGRIACVRTIVLLTDAACFLDCESTANIRSC